MDNSPSNVRSSTPATESTPATRERIVRAVSRLMQRQGYAGTGIKQISQEASATLGSVYHFFPGGKQELAVAAIRHGYQEFHDELRSALADEPDPAAAVRLCALRIAEGLHASDWADGCPVATTALGTAGRFPGIRAAAEDAFARWRTLLFDRFRDAGIDESEAHTLAHMVINTLEGAELAAQLCRSREPLEIAGTYLARLITEALPTTAGS